MQVGYLGMHIHHTSYMLWSVDGDGEDALLTFWIQPDISDRRDRYPSEGPPDVTRVSA